jgi:hypothetical protein
MSYIGSTPTTQSFIAGTDYFNGTGSATAFTLSRSVVSVNDIQATVNNVVQVPNDAYTVSGTTITFTSAPSAGTNNIYVRYLSTTTQSITPSQGTVNYNTLNSDNQSKLGISFKNRIINGAMVIDQRNAGASVTPVNDGLTLDRWKWDLSVASKLTSQQSSTAPTGFNYSMLNTSSSAYTVGASEQFLFFQSIEGFNFADCGWGTADAKTVTLSFWVRSSLTGTFGGSLRNSATNRSYPYSYTISTANTWEQKSITIAGDTTGTWVGATNGTGVIVNWSLGAGSNLSGTAGAWVAGSKTSVTGATSVVGTNGATFYITGVQLEVGTQATTFDYRSYGTELALCQRYFQTVGGVASGSNQRIGPAASYSTTIQDCSVAFSPTMRTAPTLTAPSGSNYYTMYSNGGGYGFSSISMTDASTQSAGLRGNAGVPANGCGWFNWSSAPSGSILGFSAEL